VKARSALIAALLVTAISVAGAPAPAATSSDGVGVFDPAAGRWYLRDPASGETTAFF
jgi:hypothetical protein